MNRSLAYIIDCNSHGNFHEVINQGYLMMISQLYDNVIYIIEDTACDNLLCNLEKCNITLPNVTYERIKVKEYDFKPGSLCGLLTTLKLGFLHNKYYRRTPQGADVYFNSFYNYGALLNHWFKACNNNVSYLCHSELELIKDASHKGICASVFGVYLKFIFRKIRFRTNTKFILLSPDMADTFRSYVCDYNKERIVGIDHCYIRPALSKSKNTIDFAGIKIGLPGTLSPDRGLNDFKKLLNYHTAESIKFYSVSILTEEIDNSHFVILNNTGSRLPFEEYSKLLSHMDAFLFLYGTNSYKLTASGALLEAIWNEKPIFALKNSYFEYIFNKFGKIGYLGNSIEDLSKQINNLKVSDINLYKDNLQKAKEYLSPYNIKDQLYRVVIDKDQR